ncbi:putative isoaspartyl peptidase L-asparaginase 3 isoform X1 [Chlorella sorokiniana]|uniref:beta-aspartyl-peptidase n=1 Tax=Chlorella sorokiniana TaxID=3076 RepID=A0A2P6TCD1_CHLSO|nr:putative isoaspartyl peptidase L-asparaginase 3 isoform X1 [Chlorella sorokiniana]|eukprot:PRW20287.1 putative isoaspartyl peptidase L-asparaginase 3 isoform X1 [Chlorella sorokiniana]
MQRQAAPLLLLALFWAALAAPAHGWDMSMTSLADKLGDAIEVKGIQQGSIQSKLPLVLNVWPFVNATMAGWAALNNGSSSTPWLDAVEKVGNHCEDFPSQCGWSVGYGSNADESGDVTLDAMIMRGDTMDAGAVAYLKDVCNAISAARLVMEHTPHTILAGGAATQFAQQMGLPLQTLNTQRSTQAWQQRVAANCTPNCRVDVEPANSFSMAAIGTDGKMAAGSTTNGWFFKVPGRTGDSSVPGAAAYVDGEVGACGCTGQGDINLRFLMCYQAVEFMRGGMDPKLAAEAALRRIVRRYSGAGATFGLFAVNATGYHGGAAFGWERDNMTQWMAGNPQAPEQLQQAVFPWAYAYQDAGTGGKAVWVEVEDLSRIPEPQQSGRR